MNAGHGSHFDGGSGKAPAFSAWLAGDCFIIGFGIGIYTNSVAAISDAFHKFSALGGLVRGIVAGRNRGLIKIKVTPAPMTLTISPHNRSLPRD